MFRLLRATAYAVTAIVVASTATYSRPSLAWETKAAAPPVVPYLDHAAASLEILSVEAAPETAPETAAPSAPEPEPIPAVTEHSTAAPQAEEAHEREGPGRSLGELVSTYASNDVPDAEHECLAGAVYFESKGEPLSGQVAVGQVIANRAKSGRFPKSWCGVVFQRSQFSFVRGGNLPAIPRSSAHWKTAVAVAHIVANDLTDAVVPKALFFHARYVSPNWKRVSKVATVGNHIFYR